MAHTEAAVHGKDGAGDVAASSDARNATAEAISSGPACLPSGTRDVSAVTRFSPRTAIISVVTTPGATTLTVMLREATSLARDRANPTSAALAAP